jgi:hypothetical protein
MQVRNVFLLLFLECNTPVELGFLVDRSGSISRQNFDKVKAFVVNVIAGFDVSREGTHIGLISYSSNATTVISFDQFDDPNFDYEKLNDTVRDGLDYPEGGETRIDLALKEADEELFSDITKYRSFVPKVGMLRNKTENYKQKPELESNLLKHFDSLYVFVYVIVKGDFNRTCFSMSDSPNLN